LKLDGEPPRDEAEVFGFEAVTNRYRLSDYAAAIRRLFLEWRIRGIAATSAACVTVTAVQPHRPAWVQAAADFAEHAY